MPHTYADLLALADDEGETIVDDSTRVSGEADSIQIESVTNALIIESDRDRPPQHAPMELSQAVALVHEHTNGWPRRIGNALFVHDPHHGICWLEKPPDLFGWLQRDCGIVEWHRGCGYPSKDELFSELRRTATAYQAIEYLPHYPPIPRHYYACEIPPPGNGEALSELLAKFSPETDVDRLLIATMFATVFWGGQGGARPAFVIISDSGRGAGKSKLTDMVAHLAAGLIDVAPHEKSDIIRQRLLSPDGLDKRIVRIDNVKSLKFSWAELESLITSPVISGKRMYVGEGCRPNTITWLLTLNGVSLSTDMAQRTIQIKIARPQHTGAWESNVLAFIDKNRSQLIADLLGFLQIEESTPLQTNTRWGAWEESVLCRLENAAEIQKVVATRCRSSDTELEEAEEIEGFFHGRLEELGYEAEVSRVHIPTKIAAGWYREYTNDRHKTTIACSKILSQFCEEGRCRKMRINPTRTYGRGFAWNGSKVGKDIDYDILDRIKEKIADAKESGKKYQEWWDK